MLRPARSPRQTAASPYAPGLRTHNVIPVTVRLQNQPLTTMYCKNIEWGHVFLIDSALTCRLLCQRGTRL
jgi:hypothetical protein